MPNGTSQSQSTGNASAQTDYQRRPRLAAFCRNSRLQCFTVSSTN